MLYAFEMYCLIVWFGLALSLDIYNLTIYIQGVSKKTPVSGKMAISPLWKVKLATLPQELGKNPEKKIK